MGEWGCGTSWAFCLVCLRFSGLLGMGGWVVLGFGFRCCGGSDGSKWPLFENRRLLFSHNKKSVSPISPKFDAACSGN